MYTDFITTTAYVVAPTHVADLSSFDYCTWLDHHIFKDTSLTPTGYDFIYPLTAFGGQFDITGFNKTISGGPFYDYCYQDFCLEEYSFLTPINIFCVANVNFVLSALDESAAKIIRIVYDFDDGSEKLIRNYNYTLPQYSLKDLIVSHTYFPTENFETVYYPSVFILYEDGCTSWITFSLHNFKCGIYIFTHLHF